MTEQYIAIDLKSFYASVECRERGLDPLVTNLLVADPERTDKTICLAVSPPLKALGVPSRPRLFEAEAVIKRINAVRRRESPSGRLDGSSFDLRELEVNPMLAVGYITAPPRMALYIKYSRRIYEIYLKYISPEDIHVYSIDEVFIYATPYMKLFGMSAEELASAMIKDISDSTGITATAGIGTNLFLCKVAMDMLAKKAKPDPNGVRMASLDVASYRRLLWDHEPITDFWRVGHGYAARLATKGLRTMGDIARFSITHHGSFCGEDILYSLFGVNAELLIDHAWGEESCRMEDIKAYRPESSSLSSGQVLQCPYRYGAAMTVIREMADALALDLFEKRLLTDSVTLAISYDRESLTDNPDYRGELRADYYGRLAPKGTHGSITLPHYTSSTKEIVSAFEQIAEGILDKSLLIRRITLSAGRLIKESEATYDHRSDQLDIFSMSEERVVLEEAERVAKAQERSLQGAVSEIKQRFGKNAIFRGMSLEEEATAIMRNGQIGGHKA